MATAIISGLAQLLPIVLIIIKQYISAQDDRKKRLNAEDARIDSINNADGILSELDRLRNEPAANRP